MRIREPIDIPRMRKVFAGEVRTHADDCWYWSNHPTCAIAILCDELERLRADNARLADELRRAKAAM